MVWTSRPPHIKKTQYQLHYNHNITIPQYVLIYTQIYPVGLHYINDATCGIIVAGFLSEFLWIFMRGNSSSLLTTVSTALSTLSSMLSRAQGQLIWHLQAHGLGQPALPFATWDSNISNAYAAFKWHAWQTVNTKENIYSTQQQCMEFAVFTWKEIIHWTFFFFQNGTWQGFWKALYSWSCLNLYLFVQAQKYGLLQCMGYGNGAKIWNLKLKKTRKSYWWSK